MNGPVAADTVGAAGAGPMDRRTILERLYAAVDLVNEALPAQRRLPKTEAAVLFGEGGHYESLDCVNLLLAAEERLNDTLREPVDLAGRIMAGDAEAPPATLGALADLIGDLIASPIEE